jgi:hypothetical protein
MTLNEFQLIANGVLGLARILLWVLRLGKERAGATAYFASSVTKTKLMINGLNKRGEFIYDGRRLKRDSLNILTGCVIVLRRPRRQRLSPV